MIDLPLHLNSMINSLYFCLFYNFIVLYLRLIFGFGFNSFEILLIRNSPARRRPFAAIAAAVLVQSPGAINDKSCSFV